MDRQSGVIVINSSHPELDQLAAELANRGLLHQYFGRYFPSGLAWEKMLNSNSVTRKLFSSGPGKRRLPAGLETIERYQPGTLWEFASGFVSRERFGRSAEMTVRKLLRTRDAAIVRAALQHWNGRDPVLANHTVALQAFERAQKAGVPRVLNYPIAHHGYMRKMLEEEAELHPEFATDLRDQIPSVETARLLDAECALASTIIVGSSFVKDSFIASGIAADRVFVSSYGVDVARFSTQQRVQDGVFRVVWVGQISQRKGIKYLLEAWKSVAGPDMELVLAGFIMAAGPGVKPYEHLYRYAGFLDAAGLQNLYSSADVFVLPTLIEGMPLVVLQAMACGIPVIVTNHGPGDIVRDGIDGFHVPIRDVAAIAEKIQFLRDNPDVRAEMGRNARERALTFTWERFRKETGDYVQALLEKDA